MCFLKEHSYCILHRASPQLAGYNSAVIRWNLAKKEIICSGSELMCGPPELLIEREHIEVILRL